MSLVHEGLLIQYGMIDVSQDMLCKSYWNMVKSSLA